MMPAPPDFDQIARRLVTFRADLEDEALRDQIAAQLRQVWNARGAADRTVLEEHGVGITSMQGWIYRDLTALDR